MNTAWIVILLLAQARAGRTYTTGTALNPGGAAPQPRAGTPVAPMGGYGQARQRGGGRGGHGVRPVVAVPVPFLVGVGGYYGEPEQQQQPQQPPSVLINPNYQQEVQNPSLRDYSNAPLLDSPPLEQRQSEPPPAVVQYADQRPTIHLIALTDGTIVAALGYWKDGDMLAYITREGTRNRVSMDRVDRDFSGRLNAERQIEFKIE